MYTAWFFICLFFHRKEAGLSSPLAAFMFANGTQDGRHKKENGIIRSLFHHLFVRALENQGETNDFVFHFERDPLAVRFDAIDLSGACR